MRYYLLITFLFVATLGISQIPNQFNGLVNILSSSGGPTSYTLNTFFNHCTGKYESNQSQVGDVVFFNDGVDVVMGTITSISNNNGGIINMTVNANFSAPPSGIGAILRPTSNGYPVEVCGISNDLQTAINNYFAILVDQSELSVPANRVVFGNGSDKPTTSPRFLYSNFRLGLDINPTVTLDVLSQESNAISVARFGTNQATTPSAIQILDNTGGDQILFGYGSPSISQTVLRNKTFLAGAGRTMYIGTNRDIASILLLEETPGDPLRIGFGTNTVANGSAFDISLTGPVTFPRLIGDPGASPDGSFYYNSTLNTFRYKTSGIWQPLQNIYVENGTLFGPRTVFGGGQTFNIGTGAADLLLFGVDARNAYINAYNASETASLELGGSGTTVANLYNTIGSNISGLQTFGLTTTLGSGSSSANQTNLEISTNTLTFRGANSGVSWSWSLPRTNPSSGNQLIEWQNGVPTWINTSSIVTTLTQYHIAVGNSSNQVSSNSNLTFNNGLGVFATPNSNYAAVFGGTGGIDIAGGTTAERPSSPLVGSLRWNTDHKGLEQAGVSWTRLVKQTDATFGVTTIPRATTDGSLFSDSRLFLQEIPGAGTRLYVNSDGSRTATTPLSVWSHSFPDHSIQFNPDPSNATVSSSGARLWLFNGTRVNLTTNGSTPILTAFNNGFVGISNNQSPSYVLDINSTNAVRLPSGTTGERPVTATGLLRWNTTFGAPDWNNGTGYLRGTVQTDATFPTAAIPTANSSGYLESTSNFSYSSANGLQITGASPTGTRRMLNFVTSQTDNPGRNFVFDQIQDPFNTGATAYNFGTSANTRFFLANLNLIPSGTTRFDIPSGGNLQVASGAGQIFFVHDISGYLTGDNGSTSANQGIQFNVNGTSFGNTVLFRHVPQTSNFINAFDFTTSATGNDGGALFAISNQARAMVGFLVRNTGSVELGNTGYTRISTGTTAQRPTSAPIGSLRYNTTIPQYERFNGTAWEVFGQGGNGIYGGSGSLQTNFSTEVNWNNGSGSQLTYENYSNYVGVDLDLRSHPNWSTTLFNGTAVFNGGANASRQINVSKGQSISFFENYSISHNLTTKNSDYFLNLSFNSVDGLISSNEDRLVDSIGNKVINLQRVKFSGADDLFQIAGFSNTTNTKVTSNSPSYIIQSKFGPTPERNFDWIRVENIQADTTGNRIQFYNGKYSFPNASPGSGNRIIEYQNGVPTWINTPSGGGLTGVARQIPFTDGSTNIIFDTDFRLDVVTGSTLGDYRLNINNGANTSFNSTDYVVLSARSGDSGTSEGLFEVSDQDVILGAVGFDPRFIAYRSNGTFSSPANLTNGQTVFTMLGQGQVGGGRSNLGAIILDYAGNGSDNKSIWRFRVDNAVERMSISETGVYVNDGSSQFDLDVAGGLQVLTSTTATNRAELKASQTNRRIQLTSFTTGGVTTDMVVDNVGFIAQASSGAGASNIEITPTLLKFGINQTTSNFATIEAALTGILNGGVYTVDGETSVKTKTGATVSSAIPDTRLTGFTGTTATFTGFNVNAFWHDSRIEVYKNGLLLELTVDYTISSRTPLTLTLTLAAISADVYRVRIIKN